MNIFSSDVHLRIFNTHWIFSDDYRISSNRRPGSY